ncbi:low density lipoprotein receptor adapter protein 1-A-like [Limulus polyphemus]|uniref:Low density lipoprotein receptor adapter protein 1-A-like n=1 Tax=Limulus polyphemus TaxID=6850 RepID=A0ABM1BWT8_LIMPO|nr:low density lipoprotein receptor adapter protein 1-A-like [Limulus polyphemus]
MASFLKAVRKSPANLFGRSKHKKLPEEWGDGIRQTVFDGITFYIKYLGSMLVEDATGEASTAEAIKTIINMVCSKTTLISFCSADSSYERVVSFIATNKNETLECHAFLCSKRKIAEAVALTISQSFNIAFDLWERAREERSNHSTSSEEHISSTDSKSEDFTSGYKSNSSSELENHMTLIDFTTEESASTTVRKLGFDGDVDLDDSFSRLAESRTHPMFSTNFKPEEIAKLTNFVQSAEKSSEKDQFLNDHSDELLTL